MLKAIDVYFVGNPLVAENPQFISHVVSDFSDLPLEPHCIAVLNLPASQQDEVLQAMHQTRRFYGWLIYVVSTSHYSDSLSDGLWRPELVVQGWQRLSANAEQIKVNDPDPLLAWLWLGDRRLIPVAEHQSDSLYVYPLLRSLQPEREELFHYLAQESKRGLLTSEQVFDRIRQCNHCHCSHLNYFESCPGCSSPDVESRISLHCFTCGHVGIQSSFLRSGGLSCPNCLTQLRHIGVDYDRPLETHHCNHCALDFVEAKTQVRCIRCQQVSGVDDLISQRVYSYRVGEQGRYLLRHGSLQSAPVLALNGNVDASFLHSLLQWENKLAIRHQDEHLLMALHFPELLSYGRIKGQARMFALVEQITSRLNGLLRNTDVCCQYQDDLLLILLPRTPVSSLDVLQRKITQLSEQIDIEDFTLRVAAWTLPDKSLHDDAKVWLQNKLVDFYVAR